ncbi:hypothetical protein [Pseudonocardia sp. D17]|uniref:hypothetical protein n=1 Tax=Pseudonocardia sp. D17 TaxID=882661 RepID=UPI0030D24886
MSSLLLMHSILGITTHGDHQALASATRNGLEVFVVAPVDATRSATVPQVLSEALPLTGARADSATTAADPARASVGSERAQDTHSSTPMAALMHTCLAVLAAIAVLVIAVLAWQRLQPSHASRLLGRARAGRWPPPTSTRLSQLCVLRT